MSKEQKMKDLKAVSNIKFYGQILGMFTGMGIALLLAAIYVMIKLILS